MQTSRDNTWRLFFRTANDNQLRGRYSGIKASSAREALEDRLDSIMIQDPKYHPVGDIYVVHNDLCGEMRVFKLEPIPTPTVRIVEITEEF